MKRNSSFNRDGARAFSLIELLAVMAIMAILLVAVIPSITGIMQSNDITSAGQTFADQVNVARQIASSRDITVQVRCLQLTPQPTPGTGYNYILLWSPTANAPIGRITKLPDGVSLSQDTTTYSTLFASYTSATSTGTMTLPSGPASYVSFTVSPNGLLGPIAAAGSSADMTKTTVGIVPSRQATVNVISTALPNYVLVQINPITAATLIYRP